MGFINYFDEQNQRSKYHTFEKRPKLIWEKLEELAKINGNYLAKDIFP